MSLELADAAERSDMGERGGDPDTLRSLEERCDAVVTCNLRPCHSRPLSAPCASAAACGESKNSVAVVSLCAISTDCALGSDSSMRRRDSLEPLARLPATAPLRSAAARVERARRTAARLTNEQHRAGLAGHNAALGALDEDVAALHAALQRLGRGEGHDAEAPRRAVG
jgi:hypothetical protein